MRARKLPLIGHARVRRPGARTPPAEHVPRLLVVTSLSSSMQTGSRLRVVIAWPAPPASAARAVVGPHPRRDRAEPLSAGADREFLGMLPRKTGRSATWFGGWSFAGGYTFASQ
jgi:hypothetical protein